MPKKLGITKTTFSNLEVRYEQIYGASCSKKGYTIGHVLEEHVLPHILRLKRSKM